MSVTKQMEFERELRDGERDINSSAACSVGVGVSVTVLAVALHPKKPKRSCKYRADWSAELVPKSSRKRFCR